MDGRGAKTGFLHSSCRPRPRSFWPDLLVEHNTGKLQGLVQNVYDILVVLLVEEYFSRSTIHDQAFFFFVFLKKIHSHSPCQFVEGPPARRQDPKSTLVALTAAPLILPFFQVQDKTSRDSRLRFRNLQGVLQAGTEEVSFAVDRRPRAESSIPRAELAVQRPDDEPGAVRALR